MSRSPSARCPPNSRDISASTTCGTACWCPTGPAIATTTERLLTPAADAGILGHYHRLLLTSKLIKRYRPADLARTARHGRNEHPLCRIAPRVAGPEQARGRRRARFPAAILSGPVDACRHSASLDDPRAGRP